MTLYLVPAELFTFHLCVNLKFGLYKISNFRPQRMVLPKQQAAHDGRLTSGYLDGQLLKLPGAVVRQPPAGEKPLPGKMPFIVRFADVQQNVLLLRLKESPDEVK